MQALGFLILTHCFFWSGRSCHSNNRQILIQIIVVLL
ncbi:hypothetical protein ES288_A02G188500v1 [Gossypium darwinii]|uniref:Uncharacterized protein n=1 Tax=Gossypium darwinii TaxID=34276 RepID=A0A5D2HFL4_GOSDA|nr:hypothetical protein ES288_A02G188500v1 [Gossypium darwinii]